MKKSFTAKLWKVMRICAVQAVIAITLCGVTLAHPNYAQVLDREISITITDLPFEKALHEIEAVAQVKFAYSINQFHEELNVSLSIEKKTLRALLEELLTPRKIRYNVHEKEAAITLKKVAAESTDDQSSTHGGSNGASLHHTLIQVTGTVTEGSTQTPMAGVNVLIQGTTNGTTTDVNGKYAIMADDKDVLVFSFIGYTSLEIPVGGRTVIDVAMREDVTSLSEVVINAGYWEVKEREQTGNISRVTAEAIEKQPVSNPLQALQGRMTGVYIQQNTGMPGGGFDIQIRGQNSLRNGAGGTINGNLPLYLIDGVPFTSSSLTSSVMSSSNLRGGNPLSLINPNDIESIEVLKDADATAIYGSRGANGVVLITTKKGKAGKTRVTLDMTQGVGDVSRKVDLLNTSQYLQMRQEAIENDGYATMLEDPAYDVYWPDLKMWNNDRYTDWQEKLIGGSAHLTNAQLSIAGGTSHTQFLIGGSYYRESTVFPGSNAFHRGTGRFNINHRSEDNRFKASASVNYSASINNIISADLTAMAMSLPPNAPALYDDQGNLNWEDNTWSNPLAVLRRKYESDIENFVGNVGLSYEVLPGLNLKTSLGYTSMNVNEIVTNPLSSYSPEVISWGVTGSSNFGDSYINTWIAEPQLDYTRDIGDGILTALIGGTFQENVQSGKTIEAGGYTNDAFLENIDAATTINITDASYSQYRYAALFARLNYAWKKRYIINLTGRRDGSSRFGPGNRFANFGAAGIAWIFSDEKWMKNLSWLSFGKVRSSFGSTGSDAIGNYQYLNTYSATTYPYNNNSGVYVSRLANPEYSWETNRKFEAAVDLGFWGDRISFSSAYYLNRSTGQLVGLPLPVMTGQSTVQFNLPATVENTGWEFLLSSTLVKTKVIQWTADVNVTIPANVLREFPDLEKFRAYANRFDIGKPVFVLKGYEYLQVDPQTGLYTFADRNNDGTISSPDDYVGIESVAQQFYGGINNTLKLGNFQFDFLFQFVKQSGFSYIRSFTFPGDLSNQPAQVMARWQQPGDDSGIQRFTAFDPDGSVGLAFNRNRLSNNAVTDASFMRLKNASVSWTLPTAWCQKVKLSSGKIYIQGQNLFTITRYIGLDPENQMSMSLPPLRMITAGLQVSL